MVERLEAQIDRVTRLFEVHLDLALLHDTLIRLLHCLPQLSVVVRETVEERDLIFGDNIVATNMLLHVSRNVLVNQVLAKVVLVDGLLGRCLLG